MFVLNSVALLAFPPIGSALHLSQTQFGLWSALAIHDTSSVVGAAAKYGAVALAIATTVKLARALWIVPLALATAAFRKHKAKIQWPWFILLFCLAAMLNTYLPQARVLMCSFRVWGSWASPQLFFLSAAEYPARLFAKSVSGLFCREYFSGSWWRHSLCY